METSKQNSLGGHGFSNILPGGKGEGPVVLLVLGADERSKVKWACKLV